MQFVKIDVLQGAEREIFLKFAAYRYCLYTTQKMNKEIKTPHNTEKEVWNTPKVDVIEIDVTDIIATSGGGSTEPYQEENQTDIWTN